MKFIEPNLVCVTPLGSSFMEHYFSTIERILSLQILLLDPFNMVRNTLFTNGGHISTHKRLIISTVPILLNITKKSHPQINTSLGLWKSCRIKGTMHGITCRQHLFNCNRICLSHHIYFCLQNFKGATYFILKGLELCFNWVNESFGSLVS